MSTTSPSLARSSAIMAAGSLVSRVLGLVRQSMIFAVFGTSLAGSAFNVANTLPNTIYLLVAGGVLNAVLVPQIVKAQQAHDGGRDFTDRLITISLVLLAAVTVVCLAATSLLVRLMANFHDPAALDLAIKFALIMMPALFFYGLYAVLGQVLNARERFGPFMWAPVLCNVVWIAFLGYFLFVFGRGSQFSPAQYTPAMIWTLAGSLTLGVAAQALVLVIPLWRDGFRYRPRWGVRGVGLGSAGRVAGWTFAALCVSQLGIVAQSNVLTTVAGGYPGYLSFTTAFLLFMTPHGIVTVSLVTALFTAMSQSAARGDTAAYRSDIIRALSVTGAATLPVMVGTLVLGTALTRVVFPGNTIEATDALGYLTMAMMLGLPAYAWLYTLQRAFYAAEDARTPFYLQLVNTGVAAAFTLACLLLPWEWRALGVALSQALSNIVGAFLAVLWMRTRLGSFDLYETVRTQVRVFLACVPAALLAAAVFWLSQLLLPHFAGAVVALVVGGALFLACFVYLARRMRVREIDRLLEPLLRRGRSLRARSGPSA